MLCTLSSQTPNNGGQRTLPPTHSCLRYQQMVCREGKRARRKYAINIKQQGLQTALTLSIQKWNKGDLWRTRGANLPRDQNGKEEAVNQGNSPRLVPPLVRPIQTGAIGKVVGMRDSVAMMAAPNNTSVRPPPLTSMKQTTKKKTDTGRNGSIIRLTRGRKMRWYNIRENKREGSTTIMSIYFFKMSCHKDTRLNCTTSTQYNRTTYKIYGAWLVIQKDNTLHGINRLSCKDAGG